MPTGTPGQTKIPDADIAKWCAANQNVLVTADQDFKGRWMRSGLLGTHGVEVIVFMRDLEGLSFQHATITKYLPNWQGTLSLDPYGYRVWDQPLNRPMRLRASKYRP